MNISKNIVLYSLLWLMFMVWLFTINYWFAQSQETECPPEECEQEKPGGWGRKSSVTKISVDLDAPECGESLVWQVTTRYPDQVVVFVTLSWPVSYSFVPVIENDWSFTIQLDYNLPTVEAWTYDVEVLATHTPTQTLTSYENEIIITPCRTLLETGWGEPTPTLPPQPFEFRPEDDIILPTELPKTGSTTIR